MAKSERRLLAEELAAARGIKVESAMRYIQRAIAPEGKQQIKNPKFEGVDKKLAEEVKEYVLFEKELQEQIELVQEAFDAGETVEVSMYAEYDFGTSDKRNDKARLVTFRINENEMKGLLKAMDKGSQKTGDFLLKTKDANFMGDNGKVKNIRNIEIK